MAIIELAQRERDAEGRGSKRDEAHPANVLPEWSLARRVLFRFTLVYFVLYLFPFPLDVIPYVGVIAEWYQNLWNAVVPWVGKHLFQVDITVRPNGSGDTTYNYVQVLCYLVLALVAAALWSLLDRRRPNHARLAPWLRVYLRFGLAAVMISYGAIKVIKSQFPAPALDRLLQPFGDASPMGLLWTFMGASLAYNVFSGICEMLGGLLLLSRRTTLLGALLSIAVISNIVALNFCYDVPVKLYSLHLLVMACLLAAPDARRLASFFLLNRTVEPAPLAPLFERPWLCRGALVLRTLLIVVITGFSLYGAYQGRHTYGDLAPKPPLYGIWNVEEIEVDGKVRPPLASDETRWRRVVFGFPGQMSIQLMSNSRQRYNLKLDAAKGTLALAERNDPTQKFTLAYRQSGPGLLALEGTLGHQKIRASLKKTDLSSFLLMNRGFHWINEFPFNR
jgi:hypothetical protein